MGNGITLEWQGFDEEKKLKGMGEGASAEWRKREGRRENLRVKMMSLSGVWFWVNSSLYGSSCTNSIVEFGMY